MPNNLSKLSTGNTAGTVNSTAASLTVQCKNILTRLFNTNCASVDNAPTRSLDRPLTTFSIFLDLTACSTYGDNAFSIAAPQIILSFKSNLI